jgi:hypothetical protein
MTMQRPTTRAERAAKEPATVPGVFVPRFWEDADQRQSAVKEIKRRYAALREDIGVDSYQKDILCQRATFIALQLETMEIDATEGRDFPAGQYTQAVNCLVGLFKVLGLEKEVSQVIDLKAYVGGRVR